MFLSWLAVGLYMLLGLAVRTMPAGAHLYALGGHSRAGLDLPLAVSVCVQVESFSNLGGRWCRGQVLLVGKNEYGHTLQVLLFDQLGKLLWWKGEDQVFRRLVDC